jgi:hypothetical protein
VDSSVAVVVVVVEIKAPVKTSKDELTSDDSWQTETAFASLKARVVVVEYVAVTVLRSVVVVSISYMSGCSSAPLHSAGRLEAEPTTVLVWSTRGELGAPPPGYQSAAE